MFERVRKEIIDGWEPDFYTDGQQYQRKSSSVLPWIEVSKSSPYFVTDDGKDWHPIGQNDAITWVDLEGIFRRRNLGDVETYLRMLSENGVTCLRLMLEYCQGEHRFLERPVGHFTPNMVKLWDDLFSLCEKYSLRILLTPYDTFWMWIRWERHPYNIKNGGICAKRSQWLLSPEMRKAVKERLAFATARWGGSGALFAWDLWNEIHPAHAGDSAEIFHDFVEDIGGYLRETELRLHGRAHPQTVSIFGPIMEKDERIGHCAFCHPVLDFASTHFYAKGTIDHPKNTIGAALSTGRLTREAISNMKSQRPFFDSEHGPIHTFKDRRITLPEPFDDEYFRHIQWAHFASGGAGGGMRWPNRHPHSLTQGMRKAQHALSKFLPLIDWQRFQRRNLNEEIELSDNAFCGFACGDNEQAVIWILRTDQPRKKGMVDKTLKARSLTIKVPGLRPGYYQVTAWDTSAGCSRTVFELYHDNPDYLSLPVPAVRTDVALALRHIKS
jgi:mannan endo-1,4-beta-mannosidase